jgi:hypothetical protein
MSSGLTKVNKGVWMGIKTTPAVLPAISNSDLSYLKQIIFGAKPMQCNFICSTAKCALQNGYHFLFELQHV